MSGSNFRDQLRLTVRGHSYALTLITTQKNLVDAKLVRKLSIGRIEEMKIFRRNLLLASSALALVMLFGCSSSEESSSSGSGSSGNSDCQNACYGDNVPDMQLDECLAACSIPD